MNSFLYTLLIALSNNVDNVGARIAYSIRGIRVSLPVNLYISVITFVVSTLAAYSGTFLSRLLTRRSTSFIAMFLFVAIGSWMILDQQMKRGAGESCEEKGEPDGCKKRPGVLHVLSRPEKADWDDSMHIDFKEATLLGLALSLNNVGGGLSAGVIGLNALLVGTLSAVLNFLAFLAGNYIAEFFLRWNLQKKATIAAGVLLILIGINQVL